MLFIRRHKLAMLISADQDETAFGTARLPTERKTYTKFTRENSAKRDRNKQQKTL